MSASQPLADNPLAAMLLDALRPLEPTQGPLTAEPAARSANPVKAAYDRLVDDVATHFEGRDEGLYDVKQLRPLSKEQRALILNAKPDVQNKFTFEPDQIAEVLEGLIDARLWLAANTEGALRQQLFDDVMTRLARDEERRSATESDEFHARQDGLFV